MAPGTSVGTLLRARCRSPRPADVPATTFVEGTGTAFNTIPPTDAGFFETVHALLQDEPADAGDPEIVGHLAELGIVKGKPFAPDERMRGILEEAATVGNATSRALMFDARGEEDVVLVPGLGVDQHAVQRRLPVRDTDPAGHPRGDQAVPAHRCPQARPAHPVLLRLHRDHPGDGDAPHRHRLASTSPPSWTSNKDFLDGAEVVHGDPAARHPPGPVLVAHAVRQPDPLDARHAAALSRGPAASRTRRPPRWPNADGSTTIHVGPEQPADVADGNWIQTMPGKGFFAILRLYSPLQPFFDKSWRVGEFEPNRQEQP